MPAANSLKVFRSLFQIMYRLYRGVVFIFSTCHTSVVFPSSYSPLHQWTVSVCAGAFRPPYYKRTPSWRTLARLRQEDWLQTMFCSCSRLPAIREVVFKDMLRMRSSTFRVFRACEEASGGEGFAEDFSLTRDISAAELTHIDHKRKRMPRYFKPLQGT